MRTVQQYYDDNRDKILFDVRALEEYEKETIRSFHTLLLGRYDKSS